MIKNPESVNVNGARIDNVVLQLYAVWETQALTLKFYKSTDTTFSNPLSEVTFDGYNWLNRIDTSNSKIIVKAYQINNSVESEFAFNGNDNITLIWTDSNGNKISSAGMVNKGEYLLTLTCERNGVSYVGKASLNIVPYTGELKVELNVSTHTYNGSQPSFLAALDQNATVYVDNDSDGSYDENIDYKLNSSELNTFIKTYTPSLTTPNIAPVDAGSYTLTLTAPSTSSNFYNAADSKAATGSATFIITPYTSNIYIDVDTNLVYNGKGQNPILGVYLGG